MIGIFGVVNSWFGCKISDSGLRSRELGVLTVRVIRGVTVGTLV